MGAYEDRWRRVGANDPQMAVLQSRWTAMSPEEQARESLRIASVSDGDLRAELAAPAEPSDPVEPDPADPLGRGDASLFPSDAAEDATVTNGP